LAKLADQITRGTGPKGGDKITRAVGRIENRYKLAKLFDISVAEDGFSFARNPAHRRRGQTRWFLRHPHQRRRQSPGGRARRRCLQGPLPMSSAPSAA
jgi:hypothetical protein